MTLFFFALQNRIYILVFYFISFLFGFFNNSQWGPGLEFSCEIAYPVGEANANGFL
jgi:hypothetical protein